MQKYKTLLTIAGSDSIGGAGIQADIKTATSLGVYAMSAVTAVTAQDSCSVKRVESVSPQMLRLQLESIFCDEMPDAVKIGMVPSAEHATEISEVLERYSPPNIVVDTVMLATSGLELSMPEAVDVLTRRVFPMATLITPNIPEAEVLSGSSIGCTQDQCTVAKGLVERYGCRGVLLKGGHNEADRLLTDVLAIRGEDETIEFSHPRIATRNTHGTGCTLSSAIASFLALGHPFEIAVAEGIDYLQCAIGSGAAYSFGDSSGHGPVNHLYNS